jgi:hypothetical protein
MQSTGQHTGIEKYKYQGQRLQVEKILLWNSTVKDDEYLFRYFELTVWGALPHDPRNDNVDELLSRRVQQHSSGFHGNCGVKIRKALVVMISNCDLP